MRVRQRVRAPGARGRRVGRVVLLATVVSLAGPGVTRAEAQAQSRGQAEEGAWFGVPLPPGRGEVPAVDVGSRGPTPAMVPAGEERFVDLEGERIYRDLEAIVGFSRESQTGREVGSGQLWGRITGFPSGLKTIEWTAAQFRAAGIQDVEVQTFQQDDGAEVWLPLSWELRVVGNEAFGAGTRDVVLESAMPLGGTEIEGGSLTAPLIYVGSAREAELEHADVRGKIAVQEVIPQGHMVFERGPAVSRAQSLMERGAVAVINVVRLPGNENARDFSNCGGPCFNVGGRDGLFLQNVLDAAMAAGVGDAVRATLSLEAREFSGLSAANAVAVIPGRSSAEAIIINAHVDGWFDGAGDNGDGLAATVAVARHFARPENRPERTLVFVGSAGHHSGGLNGPRNFVEMNEDLGENAILVINVEHVAQRNIAPARTVADDDYRDFVADMGEAPIVAGITNDAPYIHELLDRSVQRYGINFISERSTYCGGECGGYSPLGAPRLGLMQAPPLYHTSGEEIEMISIPGLERAARFLAYFISEVDRAPLSSLDP